MELSTTLNEAIKKFKSEEELTKYIESWLRSDPSVVYTKITGNKTIDVISI